MVANNCRHPSAHCPSPLAGQSLIRVQYDLDQSAHVNADAPSLKKHRERKVRFCVVEDVKYYDIHPSQFDDDVYWSARDRCGFVRRARHDCTKWKATQQAHTKDLETAYHHCSDASISTDKQREDIQAMFDWTKSDGRGLERGVSEVIRSVQRTNITQIVRRYKYLTTLDGSKSDTGTEEVARALGAFCRQKTSMSREFAYKMGLGDSYSF